MKTGTPVLFFLVAFFFFFFLLFFHVARRLPSTLKGTFAFDA